VVHSEQLSGMGGRLLPFSLWKPGWGGGSDCEPHHFLASWSVSPVCRLRKYHFVVFIEKALCRELNNSYMHYFNYIVSLQQ
jgi:hypothetical protein